MVKSALRTAAAFLPKRRDLKSLRTAAEHCEGCPLFANATQTVFGAGPSTARVMLIGEQPGDREDLAGEPFVGPAGRLLDKVLAEVGVPRKEVYVTNAVKHFKWTPRGKKRLHAKPSSREIYACHPWLEAELEAVAPEMVVLLGATAAQALLGPKFRITKQRGQPLESEWSDWTLATYHPSAVLRAMTLPDGEQMLDDFTADLRLVAKRLKKTE
jgi:uracil-DNA glycosylase family protein